MEKETAEGWQPTQRLLDTDETEVLTDWVESGELVKMEGFLDGSLVSMRGADSVVCYAGKSKLR